MFETLGQVISVTRKVIKDLVWLSGPKNKFNRYMKYMTGFFCYNVKICKFKI